MSIDGVDLLLSSSSPLSQALPRRIDSMGSIYSLEDPDDMMDHEVSVFRPSIKSIVFSAIKDEYNAESKGNTLNSKELSMVMACPDLYNHIDDPNRLDPAIYNSVISKLSRNPSEATREKTRNRLYLQSFNPQLATPNIAAELVPAAELLHSTQSNLNNSEIRKTLSLDRFDKISIETALRLMDGRELGTFVRDLDKIIDKLSTDPSAKSKDLKLRVHEVITNNHPSYLPDLALNAIEKTKGTSSQDDLDFANHCLNALKYNVKKSIFRPNVVERCCRFISENPNDHIAKYLLQTMVTSLAQTPNELMKVWFQLNQTATDLDEATDKLVRQGEPITDKLGRRGKSPGTDPSTSTAKGILDDTIQAALRNMNPSDKIKTLAIVMDMDMFDKSGMILQNRFDIMNAMEDHI